MAAAGGGAVDDEGAATGAGEWSLTFILLLSR
jgi:hypothetical protein